VDVLDPTDRTACWVFVGGEWWPGVVGTWERREYRSAAAFAWVTVTEVLQVPRVGVVEAPSRYVQWFPADRLIPRANDERRPTHPHG
jgi:hypothetical protein